MSRSWLDEEKTDRSYKQNNLIIRVINEYRPVKCNNCDQFQYCKLTHIFYSNKPQPEYHINIQPTLSELKNLPVTYDKKDKKPVFEEKIDGKWCLTINDDIIALEV
ncbi:MAG: hypothetical protein ACTSVE_02560 [Candidatus Helarchaeota archaeon]